MFMKMQRRIIYYVVFITLLWSVFAENEENIRNIFQNNITRGDFGNLLQSLIKLNEQRVNVLQKLYKLEDYGVLSEVLRSGHTKKTTNGNKNLFLVVLSKNQSAATRRDMDAQIVDSVPSLDIKSNNINPNLIISFKNEKNHVTHILEPAPVNFIDTNARPDKFELIIGGETPKKIKMRNNRFQVDTGRHKHTIPAQIRITEHERTTNNPTVAIAVVDVDNNYLQTEQDRVEDEHSSNTPKIALNSGESKKQNKKVKGRFEIDDGRGKITNAGIPRLKVDNNSTKYPKTAKDIIKVNDHTNQYPKKPKDLRNTDHHSSKYNKKDNDNPNIHSNRHVKVAKDMSKDEGTKYPNTPKDMYDADIDNNKYQNTPKDIYDADINNNKYPNTPKDIYDADINNNKYPKTPKDMYDADINNNKYPKTKNDDDKNPPPDIYNVDDKEHKVLKVLKNMYDTEDYPKLSIETYGETKTNTHLSKEKSKDDGHNLHLNGFDDVETLESRKNLQKCIGKRALKLCSKSCITAYKNVCRRLKCTSRSKKSLKKECKKSCTTSFSTSKYSSED